MSKKKEKKVAHGLKNKKTFNLTCLVISLILCLTSIVFDLLILRVNIFPLKYLLPLLIGTNLFVVLCTFILIVKKFKLWLKFVSMFFSIILIFIFIIICLYISKTYDFMGKIKSKNLLTEEYYIIVKNDSKIDEISELEDKIINTFDEKVEIYNEALEKLNSVGNFELKNAESIEEMANNLLDDEVDAILISSFHKELVDEEIEEFSNSTKIIYTINVEIKHENKIESSDKKVTKEAFSIYVSGIDTYGSISNRSRSDVNMIVTINPTTHQILLTSIPRDYYVQLHNTTGYKDKLTHAGLYGVDMSIKTLEDLIDIDIDYYVRVNFSTLIKVVDTLGGIDVYSDKGFVPYTNRNIYIPKGDVHMNGEMALAFARERYTYVEGDRHRVKNQQDVISAIIKKVTSSTTILTKYTTLLDQLSSSFETNIDVNDITSLIKMQIDKMPSWTILNYSLNGSDLMDYTYSYGSQKLYVMVPYENTIVAAHNYITDMIDGKTITIKEEDKMNFVSYPNNSTSSNLSSNNEAQQKPSENKEENNTNANDNEKNEDDNSNDNLNSEEDNKVSNQEDSITPDDNTNNETQDQVDDNNNEEQNLDNQDNENI